MKRAFTLTELIIAVIIVGILVSFAMPKLTFAIEKARAAEGVKILGILREAQIRYNSVNQGLWLNGTYNSVDLDVSISTPKFFDLNQTSLFPPAWGPSGGYIAATRRIPNTLTGGYYLAISLNGKVYCSGGALEICDKINIPYPPM